jgi:hypothetical protein
LPQLRVFIDCLEHVWLHHANVVGVLANDGCHQSLANFRQLPFREGGWLEKVLIPKAVTMTKLNQIKIKIKIKLEIRQFIQI